MAWLEIAIGTAASGIEDVAAALSAAGFSELVLEDEAELTAFLDQTRAYWDYLDESLEKKLRGLSRIRLYLEDGDEASLARLRALVERLRTSDGAERFGPLTLEATPLPETDWAESWKENYPPQQVGKRLVILPYWLADADTEGREPVILDPGLTFGTGAHPSTRMVLEAMETYLAPGGNCLDLGSGSGILSIAALRLGAASAVGVDIDPKAEDAARENAAYNGFAAPAFTALTGSVTADKGLMARLSAEKYDLVLVNIVADVIIQLAPVLPEFLGPESTLICSGILAARLGDVLPALENAGLTIIETRAGEDWRCVVAKKRGK